VTETAFAGLRVLHLQSRSGAESLSLVEGGATVIGIDSSRTAVHAARALAVERGLGARFIEADLYDARHSLPEPESFDVVYTDADPAALPDMGEWARIVVWFLTPGGRVIVAGGRAVSPEVVTALEDAGLSVDAAASPFTAVLGTTL
jgi:predicted O-methyltransferase YrrM